MLSKDQPLFSCQTENKEQNLVHFCTTNIIGQKEQKIKSMSRQQAEIGWEIKTVNDQYVYQNNEEKDVPSFVL